MEVYRLGLVIYNDLTRKKEPFVPLKEGEVGFYSCGPTVYDYFHIGNARPFIVFDVFRRYLEDLGYKVTFVQNFTDIDDKMINRANEEGITVKELADRFIKEYFEDTDSLGVRRATIHPRATEHMEDIVRTVEILVEKGHAYVVNGDVFFSVESFTEYGKLSKQSIEDLQSGARIDINERKRHPLDFALWKSQKPGEPAWESPWGMGRPGWHIECSVMSTKYLGDTFDIHSGGCDLIFPHHENEVAQAEAATGVQFVRYWLHNGYLLINKEKMSKSLGNFLTVRNARKKFSPLAIRYFMLSAHYRSPINFSEEGLSQATGAVERLRNCWTDLQYALQNREMTKKEGTQVFVDEIKQAENKFYEEMNDDFNTAGALGAVFEVVRSVNTYLKENTTLDEEACKAAEQFFRKIDNIMGILGFEAQEETLNVSEIEAMIEERTAARKSKDFAKSDAIRDELAKKGIILEDTPEGTKWKKQL
jgi:cysteinyl-tRNA synthetase